MANHEEENEVYAVSYLTIQTSDIDNNVLLMVEELTKRLAKKGIKLYTAIQSGKPTQPPPCPPGQNCQ